MSLRSDFKINALTPENQDVRDRIVLRGPDSGGNAPQPHRVAFLVTHGMGQQVPFETLSMIGQALITEHSRRHPNQQSQSGDDFQVDVRRVQLTAAADAPELSRAEVILPPHQGKSVEAHIYESYWAPLTEGQISFLQTVGFLYSAAWNGVRTALQHDPRSDTAPNGEQGQQPSPSGDGLKHFDRWMFGKFHDMAIKRHTYALLLAVVASISLLLIPALLIFTPWGLSSIEWIGKWIVFGGTHWHLSLPPYSQWLLVVKIAIPIVVLLFVVLALVVRYFVVEYVGDVAIYVSSYKVSRFDEIRNNILAEACTVARQIYSAGISDGTHPSYDSIVIVGHSLGSVISYDMLNSCINWDQVECDFKRKVVPRTTRFITFGSPLDKTAFLFRTQVSSARNLREALAARVQPLILDYQKFRPLKTFRWINIHAPADIISGSLEYYDATDATGLKDVNRVDNIVDPDATTPLLAHVQYWDNRTLHKSLYDAAWVGSTAA